jgi:sterol desaturase/sphingolipid hydroxylase (fatty acid hydroxylase superfamily)
LRLVVASPAFHRWHHTAETKGIDKNYAALFPFLDLAFGSLHFPKRASSKYGLGFGQHMELNLLSQLAHPFTKSAISRDSSGA